MKLAAQNKKEDFLKDYFAVLSKIHYNRSVVIKLSVLVFLFFFTNKDAKPGAIPLFSNCLFRTSIYLLSCVSKTPSNLPFSFNILPIYKIRLWFKLVSLLDSFLYFLILLLAFTSESIIKVTNLKNLWVAVNFLWRILNNSSYLFSSFKS